MEGGVVDPAKLTKIMQNQSSFPAFSHTQVDTSGKTLLETLYRDIVRRS